MIAWMAYAALVAGIVAAGGLAMERLAASMGQPRRIAWVAALTLAVVIPLVGGWRGPEVVPVAAESGTAAPATAGGIAVEDLWSVIPALPVPQGMATGWIARFAWAAGSLAVLAVLAGVLVQVARGRRRWDRARVHGADVYVSRGFGPALVGVARPQVVIPAWVLDLDPGARKAIIRHEAEHARARDHLVLLCGGLVVAAFPWSPAIWWMYRRLRAAVELDCDQRVLASGIGVADYGDVLLGAGCRSRGRWSFSPAMGQPESLLERRLKTMSETGKKLSGGHAALLVAVALGALVAACDTPVPKEVREAFEEVTAAEEAQGADAGQEDWIERFLGASAFGPDLAPLLYVDGVRIRSEEDLLGMQIFLADVETGQIRRLAGIIDRIEVLKGAAAAKLHGEEAAGGVIQIFTEAEEHVPDTVVMRSIGEVNAMVQELVSAMELEAGAIDGPLGRQIVVSGARREGRRAVVEYHGPLPSVEHLAVPGRSNVTGTVGDWEKWLSENPQGSRPVIYVDGVRVDDGGANLLPTLAPESIDRMEVTKGEAARKEYGDEAAYGVIHIFLKKSGSSDKPSSGRSK